MEDEITKFLENRENQDKNFKGYLTIWTGQSISILGSAIVQFAIIWWLTEQTGSSLILSVATFAGLLPMVLISPFAGVLADRLNKKVVLITTDTIQAIATLGLIYLYVINIVEVWHVLVLLAVRGTMQAFQFPVAMTVVSLMVPEENIPKVNAANTVLNSIIFILSPGIGALLLGFFDVGNILWLDVFTFLPAAVVIFTVFIPKTAKKLQEETQKASFTTEFKEGFIYIKDNGLVPLFAVFALFNILLNPLFSLLPLYVVYHNGGSAEFALLQGIFQAGVLAASIALILMKNYKPTVRSIFESSSITVFAMFLLALSPKGNYLVLGAATMIAGISVALIDTQFLSVLQIYVPSDIQGRVFSSGIMLIKSILPIALVVVGFIAEFIPLTIIFIMSPILMLITLIGVYFTMDLSKFDENLSNGKNKIKKDISAAKSVGIE
jgi:DHA3 family macrolide efflux protein-like MFS transporter